MGFLSRERFELHPSEVTQPKYAQLKSFVLAELRSGHLKPGDMLPAEPKLANSLQVARNTIRQTLRELEREGIVERIKGQGTFIRKRQQEEEQTPEPLGRLDAFAIIVPETLGGTFYSPLVSSFEKACNTIHNEMIIRSTSNSPAQQADAILALLDKRVGGIVIVPTASRPTPPYQIRQLQQQGMPVVFCHRGVKGVNAPLLAVDFKQCGRMAGEQFLKHGHKRIAFLGLGDVDDPARIGYYEGMEEAFRGTGVKLAEELIYLPSVKGAKLPVFSHEDSVHDWLKDICSREDRPTAIFAPFDPLAEMTLLLLGKMGMRVPEDISLLSLGPKWREMPVARLLSAVVVDSIQMGQKASDLLDEMRNGHRSIDNGERFDFGPELWEGATLGSVPS